MGLYLIPWACYSVHATFPVVDGEGSRCPACCSREGHLRLRMRLVESYTWEGSLKGRGMMRAPKPYRSQIVDCSPLQSLEKLRRICRPTSHPRKWWNTTWNKARHKDLPHVNRVHSLHVCVCQPDSDPALTQSTYSAQWCTGFGLQRTHTVCLYEQPKVPMQLLRTFIK
jgi:hypothetical protein